jgi:hypothetical protein
MWYEVKYAKYAYHRFEFRRYIWHAKNQFHFFFKFKNKLYVSVSVIKTKYEVMQGPNKNYIYNVVNTLHITN